MAEEAQGNSPEFLITHKIDGWVYNHIDTDYDEGSYIYQCPNCKDTIKVTPLSIDEPSEDGTGNAGNTQEATVQAEEQATEEAIEKIPEEQQPHKPKRRKKAVEPAHVESSTVVQ